MKKNYASVLAAVTLVAGMAVAMPAGAETAAPSSATSHEQGKGLGMWVGMHKGMRAMKPLFRGSVTAVNGTTLTVTSTDPKTSLVTTYTVDAASAKVTKAGAASTTSAIAVGDTIMVQGTLSGTTITAKVIIDGIPTHPNDGEKVPAITGNGQPIVAGKITAISGSTITITNQSNVTYTIDARNAKFVKPGVTTATIANLAVGETVVVQGTVNNTSITATTVIDQNKPASTSGTEQKEGGRGFFGSLGGFFAHLFGF